jgi:hypothetical protein
MPGSCRADVEFTPLQVVSTILQPAGRQLQLACDQRRYWGTSAWPSSMKNDPDTVHVPREFHRRMAAIIDAVQTGIWQANTHDLLGYATDYAFGDKRGLQTLVLKTSRRSAYVRLQWETIMADSSADRQVVENAINNAIQELT